MAQGMDNLVLEQLRLIRDDLRQVRVKIDELGDKTDGHTALLVGLGKYMHDIDERVEHVEQKLGGK